ncbi:MAG: IS200/IS605 family transposase [Phycisphaeraceae bacterium]|nr:IS200/IS605 family transposase [Phycisphaeraceae bacterium]
MPSTWTHNYYHLVFGTKHREPWIDQQLEERLFPFLGGIIKDLGGTPYAINGFVEHVHIVLRYPSDLSNSDLARHTKARSSKWIHETFPRLSRFAWQEGYGGFTVSKSVLPKVVRYVENQKEHHRKVSYVDEFMSILKRHGTDASEAEVFR